MGAAGRRNIGRMRNRKIVARRKLDLRDDRRVGRRTQVGRMAGADTVAGFFFRLLTMMAIMVRGLRRLRRCGRADLRRAGVNGLQRNAPETG